MDISMWKMAIIKKLESETGEFVSKQVTIIVTYSISTMSAIMTNDKLFSSHAMYLCSGEVSGQSL